MQKPSPKWQVGELVGFFYCTQKWNVVKFCTSFLPKKVSLQAVPWQNHKHSERKKVKLVGVRSVCAAGAPFPSCLHFPGQDSPPSQSSSPPLATDTRFCRLSTRALPLLSGLAVSGCRATAELRPRLCCLTSDPHSSRPHWAQPVIHKCLC